MPDFQIIQDEAKAARGLASFTFTVDGAPSMYWCPTRHAVERVVSRLKAGRSGEAFGKSPGVMLAGRTAGAGGGGRGSVTSKEPAAPAETVKMASGRTKTREASPTWHYALDGEECPQAFATEAEARAACACAAFMTRGKLGRIAEAQTALEAAHPGKACCVKACPKRHKVVAEVDGREVHVGFTPEGVVVKELEPKAG